MIWISEKFELTEFQAEDPSNATSFPAPSVEYNHGAIKSVFHQETSHPYKYLNTGVYALMSESSKTILYATSLLYLIGALVTIHEEIGASNVMIMVFGSVRVNVAHVVFQTVSYATNVYVHPAVIGVQLVYGFPFRVAPDRLSSE